MSKHYVYIHHNPITNQIFYIGVGYKKRAWTFKWGHSKHYYNYVSKYGTPIVEIYKNNLTEDEAYQLEEQLISKYGRMGIDKDGILVNKSSGGKTSAKGTKQHITDEWKKKIGDANRGKKKHTTETKNSISSKNSKPILQYSIDGELIKEYQSIKSASEYTKIEKLLIDNALQNPINNTTNFIWKYKNKNLTLRKGKKIKAFNNEWEFIKEYDSINQAERDLNVVGIRQFLKNKSAYVGKNKYKFKYSYDENLT
jgi:hypothetical protein